MTLTIKDLYATILGLLVFGAYYANAKGLDYPIISSTRGALIVMLLLGIGMCASSGYDPKAASGPLVVLAGILGAVSLILVIIGLVTNDKGYISYTMYAILLAWVITTLRHAFLK